MSKGKTEEEPQLLDYKTGEFVAGAKAALEEIFARYDKDKDGKLSEKELDDFAISCNGQVFDKRSKEEIKDNFEIDEKGQLTLNGFLQMYYMQSEGEPEETWNDLKKQGYDRNFKLSLIKK